MYVIARSMAIAQFSMGNGASLSNLRLTPPSSTIQVLQYLFAGVYNKGTGMSTIITTKIQAVHDSNSMTSMSTVDILHLCPGLLYLLPG